MTDYDVVVIGGGFSGASAALLVKRFAPDARVAVVERHARHGRKVGEATVEVSACFLHRELGLYDYLSREHLPKHGLRYWFTDSAERRLEEMTEIGAFEVPRLPSFQLDRARLDEHLLQLAGEQHCDILRPAKVANIELGWPGSTLTVEDGEPPGTGSTRTITTRWVIDASGRRGWIAKALDLRRSVAAHPITAMWGRWRGVADLDSDDFTAATGGNGAPRLPAMAASRRLATNHFCGYGWWCWVIPLAGGETSIGLVFNQQLATLPDEKYPRERYQQFLRAQAGLRELLADAEIIDDDFLALKHVPYATTRYADRGWALVGDAASFMDPYYSPGLDHAVFSVYASARLIAANLNGTADDETLDRQLDQHNARFARSFERWIAALYLDKYELMGDAELTACAFWFDTSMYYLGVVAPVYANSESLANPVFGLPLAQVTVAYRIMRFFNRRMLALARARRRSGHYGRRNARWRRYSRSFGLGAASLSPLFRALRLWSRMEMEQVWWRCFASRSQQPGGSGRDAPRAAS